MTSANVTQTGLEVWAAVTSSEVVTALGMEVWLASNSAESVTQAGMEVWSTNDTVSKVVATQIGVEVWAGAAQLFFSASGIWQSDVTPSPGSVYTEGNTALSWEYETVLLPDNQLMRENMVVETNLDMAFIGASPVVAITAQDANDAIIQAVSITPAGVATLWDNFNWDQAPWDGTAQGFTPYQIGWTQPLVFKQMSFGAAGLSTVGFKIGTLFLNFQTLGYQQETASGVN